MQTKVEKQPKSTLKLTVTVPNDKVKEAYTEVLKKFAENTTLEGFRKGQAPLNLVEEKTETSKLYGEVVNVLLEKYYTQAVKEHKISAISNPKVEIKEFELDKDFEFVATIATKPEITIKKDYIKDLKKAREAGAKEFEKKKEESLKKGEELPVDHYHITPDQIIKELTKIVKVEVADILIEEEVNRMFSRMIQQIQALGTSVEDYLKSINKKVEDIKKDFEENAEESIKAEFIMSHLINEEKIEVDEKEIDEMISAFGSGEAQEQMQSPTQRWYIRSILLKNKLLTKLLEEVEGENHHEH